MKRRTSRKLRSNSRRRTSLRRNSEHKHTPDYQTVRFADDLAGPRGAIIDVECRCGTSGSFATYDTDIDW